MLILPALDFRGGVLARRPDADLRTLLARWRDAPWLHVADLDRAFGNGQNDALVQRTLTEATRPVQVGGALTDPGQVQRWLEAGAARVILGADAPLASFTPGTVGLALDVQGGAVVPPGRAALADDALTLARRALAAGVAVIVWRDRDRDGTLAGAALDEARRLMDLGAAVQYAGGVADLDDLVRARDAGFAGVIVGRALLEGRFTLEEAIQCSA